MKKKEVEKILGKIVHPESGKSIVEAGIVDSLAIFADRIAVALVFARARDPFANSIKRQLSEELEKAFPEMKGKISVEIKERPKTKPADGEKFSGTDRVKKVIAIASGKGGVGKSTVASNLAVTLSEMGYKTGILDADIYGPSQPTMFGLEGYIPESAEHYGRDVIKPAVSFGVKVMSIGFFIRPDDALVWRGPMATNALRQLIHQTEWGDVDYLLIDMPPGTGDVHLTILQEMHVDGAVIVSTPQHVALADVTRGISMFRSEKISVPVLGIVENMAWFTPAELPANRYYIFGRGGAASLAAKEGIELLGEIPIIQSIMDGSESGRPAIATSDEVKKYYTGIADKIVQNQESHVQKP